MTRSTRLTARRLRRLLEVYIAGGAPFNPHVMDRCPTCECVRLEHLGLLKANRDRTTFRITPSGRARVQAALRGGK